MYLCVCRMSKEGVANLLFIIRQHCEVSASQICTVQQQLKQALGYMQQAIDWLEVSSYWLRSCTRCVVFSSTI